MEIIPYKKGKFNKYPVSKNNMKSYKLEEIISSMKMGFANRFIKTAYGVWFIFGTIGAYYIQTTDCTTWYKIEVGSATLINSAAIVMLQYHIGKERKNKN